MTETYCLTNITRAGKRRRLGMGIVVLLVTAAAAFVAGQYGLAAWRPAGTIPAAFGWLCLVQALDDT